MLKHKRADMSWGMLAAAILAIIIMVILIIIFTGGFGGFSKWFTNTQDTQTKAGEGAVWCMGTLSGTCLYGEGQGPTDSGDGCLECDKLKELKKTCALSQRYYVTGQGCCCRSWGEGDSSGS